MKKASRILASVSKTRQRWLEMSTISVICQMSTATLGYFGKALSMLTENTIFDVVLVVKCQMKVSIKYKIINVLLNLDVAS